MTIPVNGLDIKITFGSFCFIIHHHKKVNMHAIKTDVSKSGHLYARASRHLALIFLISLPLATAQSPAAEAPVVINLKQFKVLKGANGEPKFTDASLVLPGDVIEYRAVYTNRGAVPLSVIATLPVPESAEYVKDSAKSKSNLAHSVALKDLQFASEPLMKKTITSSGATLLQAVPYADYRFVRWDLSAIPAGSSVEVSIRAMISTQLDTEGSTK